MLKKLAIIFRLLTHKGGYFIAFEDKGHLPDMDCHNFSLGAADKVSARILFEIDKANEEHLQDEAVKEFNNLIKSNRNV